MYDDDEEIKRKRRNLILIILIIIAIIILLIVFLINRKNFSIFNNGMSCELQIVSGAKDKDGNYLEIHYQKGNLETASTEDNIQRIVDILKENGLRLAEDEN